MKPYVLSLLLFLPACSFTGGPFDIDTGLDGCVSIHIEEFQAAGSVTMHHLHYHRINEQCKDVPHHPVKEPVNG